MPQLNKRLPKGQGRKNAQPIKAHSVSPKNSDSTEESDSIVSKEVLKPEDLRRRPNIGLPTCDNFGSSDEIVSDSLWSKLENGIARDEILPSNVLTPGDDLDNQVSQNKLSNRTLQMCNTVCEGSSDSDEDSDAESRKEILRSAEKRIFRIISTSESDTRKRVNEKYKTSSDSDSAPENVTFETGRKTAMEVLKQRVDSIRQEKLRKKEQRKKKLEILKRQKEEKLVHLKGRQTGVENDSSSCSSEATHKPVKNKNLMNSEEFVGLGQKIYFSSESETTAGKTKPGTRNSVDTKRKKSLKRLPANLLDRLPDQATHKQQSQDDSIQHNDGDGLQPKKKQVKVNNSQMQWDTDYIPLDNSSVTQFGAVPLNNISLRKKTVAENAAAFRHNMMYGNNIKRTSANVNTIRKQKLKACGLDRLVTQH